MTTEPDSPTPDSPDATAPPKKRRSVRRRAAVGLLSLALLALLLVAGVIGLLALRSEPLVVPEWAATRLSAQVNRDIAPYSARLGTAAIVLEEGWAPRVLLSDTELLDGAGARIVSFDSLSLGIALQPLVEGYWSALCCLATSGRSAQKTTSSRLMKHPPPRPRRRL